MTSWLTWEDDEDDTFIYYCAHCGVSFDESELHDIGITETVLVCKECRKAYFAEFPDEDIEE